MPDYGDQADINRRIIRNFWGISNTMRRIYEGKGNRRRILIMVDEAGTLAQSTLTQRLDIQPGSVSEVLRKMESAGLIVREPSQTDRRTAEIRLTQEGKTMAKQAAQQREQRHAQMFSCLSPQEKKALIALLEKVNADWDQRYPRKNIT